jgi:aerobic-type carbon monoxide dehydrogenase small subunit (CoxS/CutS family)
MSSQEGTSAVEMTVNGDLCREVVESRLHLADFLRHHLGLTGTHLGCEQGVCGMCTVLVDGLPVKSCIMLAAQADGHTVTTVEALAPDSELCTLQGAFKRHHALQCGFCTPAFLLVAKTLAEEPPLDRRALREALSGVLCRCTGYSRILDAVEQWLSRQEKEN